MPYCEHGTRGRGHLEYGDGAEPARGRPEIFPRAHLGDHDHVLKPHAAKAAQPSDRVTVEEARPLRVGERRVEQSVYEIASGLDCEAHAHLERARCAQLADARLLDARRRVAEVTADCARGTHAR